MSKISELSDGGSLVSSDYLIAVRSGGNVKVRMDQINVDQIDLGDNEFIRLGNSQDLTIVHAATQSIINQAGIGDLLIQKAGSTKLTVNSSGIDVTGTVTADGLTVSASAATANITSTSGGATLNLTHPTATDGYSIRQGNANADDFRIFEGSKIKLNITTGGDISFYEDTGTTAKLFWDASAESLGIGTSSPFFTAAGRSSLSVNGTSSSILAFGKGGSSENYILADAGGLTIANTSATLPTAFFNNGSTRMTISSAGSVGIGVTPKTTNATVTGSLNVNQAGLLVRNSNQAYFASNIYWDASDQLKSYAAGYGLASLFVPSDGSHRFFNTTAAATGADQNLTLNETMRITSNGWVNPNANTTSNPADSQGLHFGWNLSNGGGESLIVFNKGAGATGGLVFSDNSANGTPVERMRLDGATGNLLVGLSSGQDALIHAQAPKTTYTDYATVFAGGTDSHNGDHAISLMTSGNSLAGIIGSNLSIDGTAFSQPETARSSGYISFSNNTTAGKTSTITFGGLIKGTATALPKMTLDGDGTLLVGESADFLATSTTATGLSVTQDGRFTLSRSGIPMNVSRLGSDGSLIDFWRQGATVGSIGTSAGHLYVGNGDTNLIFNDTANSYTLGTHQRMTFKMRRLI